MNNSEQNSESGHSVSSGEMGSGLDWKSIIISREGGIFLMGLSLALCIVFWFFFFSVDAPGEQGQLLGVITAHATGGRLAGISSALGSGFPVAQVILLASLIEGTIVCLFFSVFCLSVKRLIVFPFLDDMMANVHRSAKNQRSKRLKWGIPGLIVFVWFPFFMTGPVIGSVIGYLLGMPPWVVVGVVFLGTVGAIISWTFAINPVIEWAGRIGEFVPLILVLILLVVVVSIRMRRYSENLHATEDIQPDGDQQ